MDTSYVFYATVSNVEHRSQRFHVAGFGTDAVFKTVPVGWFIHLKESHEGIYVGTEEPLLKVGDLVKVTIGKYHAQSISAPK